MNYNEIIQLSDLTDKEDKLKKYYIEIGVLDWLSDSNIEYKKIKFADRIEYKHFDKYHRLDGPAIDIIDKPNNGTYYIEGEIMDYEKWKDISTNKIRLDKLKQII